MQILSGRHTGDLNGDFTCHKHKGSSVVDWCIATKSVYVQISQLRVVTFKAAVSDHCPIEVEIPIITHDSNSRNHFEHKLNPLPPVILWDKNSIAKYG